VRERERERENAARFREDLIHVAVEKSEKGEKQQE
jgi:hypothetical protein